MLKSNAAQVLGSRKGPVECIIGATAVGPTLHFGADSSKLLTKADIAFGNIDVLQVKPNVACIKTVLTQFCPLPNSQSPPHLLKAPHLFKAPAGLALLLCCLSTSR